MVSLLCDLPENILQDIYSKWVLAAELVRLGSALGMKELAMYRMVLLHDSFWNDGFDLLLRKFRESHFICGSLEWIGRYLPPRNCGNLTLYLSVTHLQKLSKPTYLGLRQFPFVKKVLLHNNIKAYHQLVKALFKRFPNIISLDVIGDLNLQQLRELKKIIANRKQRMEYLGVISYWMNHRLKMQDEDPSRFLMRDILKVTDAYKASKVSSLFCADVVAQCINLKHLTLPYITGIGESGVESILHYFKDLHQLESLSIEYYVYGPTLAPIELLSEWKTKELRSLKLSCVVRGTVELFAQFPKLECMEFAQRYKWHKIESQSRESTSRLELISCVSLEMLDIVDLLPAIPPLSHLYINFYGESVSFCDLEVLNKYHAQSLSTISILHLHNKDSLVMPKNILIQILKYPLPQLHTLVMKGFMTLTADLVINVLTVQSSIRDLSVVMDIYLGIFNSERASINYNNKLLDYLAERSREEEIVYENIAIISNDMKTGDIVQAIEKKGLLVKRFESNSGFCVGYGRVPLTAQHFDNVVIP